MSFPGRTISRLGAITLTLGLGLLAASPVPALAEDETHTCSGSVNAPGVLSGTFSSVVVKGFCLVNSGVARVDDNLTVRPGGALLAIFGINHKSGVGGSKLTVDGDLDVQRGGTLFLGCSPGSFTCVDDPNPRNPTISSRGNVGDDLTSEQPLGVIVHNSSVGGDVSQHGGGGGVNCNPSGIFKLFGSPVFSDYSDTWIHGDLTVTGLKSCWLGVVREHIGGDVRVVNNQFADPDAIEIISNHIAGDLACSRNSMVWDSTERGRNLFPRTPQPNKVNGDRAGQCVLSSPKTPGGPPGPGPF